MIAKSVEFQDIIKSKNEVLRREKSYKPLNELKNSIKRIKLRNSFKNSLKKDGDVAIICEYKPASPSRGRISHQKVEDVMPLFEEGGVSAASILTEESFFKSNLENLKIACKISKLPLLRKDFIMDEYQIYQSRASGASAILLMADLYPNLAEGIKLAEYLGMDALVECKNKVEIRKSIEAGAEIIGINNRDFKNFKIDLNRTKKLAGMVPPDVTLVSESGVKTADDIKLLSTFGADALLIGSSVMESNNITRKIHELVDAAKNSRIKRE